MYLKRIEAIGFKSFANKIDISFTAGINGIVGPNGCGKSNIIDAIKWVLGEQSTKNLRASGMSDVIFAGSEDYKKQNFAQVSLIFDNSDRILNIDYEEVEITRRLFRSGESEYLINKTDCRLKDILELIADTGLGKDSLSMISQGAISNFAHAKPIERRAIFEEAAGVAKYKKKKNESLRKLERTNDNLIRIGDIIAELEAQLEPLRLQANKAKKFLEKDERLKKIEVTVIVHEVNRLEIEINKAKKRLTEINEELVSSDTQLLFDEGKVNQLKENLKKYDNEINNLQLALIEKTDLISSLEKQKSEEEYRQHNDKSKEYVESLVIKLNDLSFEISGISNNLKTLISEGDDLKADYSKFKNQYDQANQEIIRKQQIKQNYQSKKDVLQNTIENKSNLFAGVKAIVDAKNSLSGIIGLVSDLFEVEQEYQEAISKAIANNLQNIVVETNDDAKDAVSFLKNNKAGRATFIPLETIKPRYLNDNDLYLAQNTEGFIDIATNLVSYDEAYQDVFAYLLNNTLVCDEISNAIKLAKATNNRYRIITLDGEVISVGGLITGGRNKNERGNLLTIKKDLEKIENYLIKITQEINDDTNSLYEHEQLLNNLRNKINQQNISIAKVEENLANRQYQLADMKNEYQSLTDEEFQENSDAKPRGITVKLNEAILERERILASLKTARETHYEINKDLEVLELQLRENRALISSLKEEHSSVNLSNNTNEIELKNMLDRLANEYQLTIDNAKNQLVIELDLALAKDEVAQLKRQIKNLGIVNLLAIDEYENVSERFEKLSAQRNDLEQARSEILAIINDTDKIMIERFSKTIDDINIELPKTFKKMFGGGKAYLEYTDPSDILETGIEIIASPPGKSVQNLTLFSGGEKALIALSVLFAILKARPIPLCILDEVEAALDQANVERFAKFLKDFTAATQFIVITHRPGTMEQCDVLYGVTMQEKGVTKMIGVHLEEAKDLVAKE
ncbi:chromosome segregation protein SMC [Erysipelotrichaceae bacterium OttesenSCG-928-M19]|nr:chromosome segregation protein SMC [Erysipelotrichaceae bacterium OttesenSCG-928-M19]